MQLLSAKMEFHASSTCMPKKGKKITYPVQAMKANGGVEV
jgi:hypothetical protein